MYCMHQPYWVGGSKGYLVHITHIPALLWNQNRVYGLISDAVVPTNKVVPVADYVWPPNCMQQQYWVRGSKGFLVHIAHIPALPWNQNSAYGLVWDAVVATNGDVPVADYDFVAVWTLYSMCKPYWFCGSKGYLVHKAHIPAAMEFKVAYMVPSVPQTRASLWQIMIPWQFGPCIVCTSHIGSVGPRAIWSIKRIYPLLWNEKPRIWPSFWCPCSHIRGHPCGRLRFHGSLDPALYVPAILGPWVLGQFGT